MAGRLILRESAGTWTCSVYVLGIEMLEADFFFDLLAFGLVGELPEIALPVIIPPEVNTAVGP